MIPAGWSSRPLGELVEVLDSRRVPVSASERAKRPGPVPYYGAAGPVGTIDAALFDEPLVLLGEDGVQFFDRAKPKAYFIDGPAWVNNHAHVLRPRDSVDRRFLKYYLDHFDYRGYANGTTRLKLTKRAMTSVPVIAPAVPAQRHIVEVLEDHLSRLDAAESYLGTNRRRALAFERSALSRCRSGTETDLAEVTQIQGGIQKQSKRAPRENPHPFLRVANVTARGLALNEVHQVELFQNELLRYRLEVGDLLVVEGNGSASQIGRAALWDGSIPDCVHQNHLIRVRPQPGLLPEYLEAVWNSPQHRHQLTDVASSSSGLYTLSVSKLKALSIPLPSLAEQHDLVAGVTQAREARRALDLELDRSKARSRALRQSLLTAAFRGELTSAGGS